MNEKANRQIKILVVDDDCVIADILKQYLSDENKSVEVCYDGSDAIKRIQKNLYDLIIVDMVLPGSDGLEVLRCAKSTNPEIIVIIMTGYASLETAIMAIKEGAYDYIRKPCKLEEIKISVGNATDKIIVNRENKSLLKELQNAKHEVMVLKQKKGAQGKIAAVNFFPSSMPGLQYLHDQDLPSDDYVGKLQALSSLRENGDLTEREFREFKSHLINKISPKG